MSGRADKWMPIYWGDYLRDTMHLRADGHGAYLMLIAHYWTTGEAPPDDDDYLAAVARLERKEWKRLRSTLATFFDIANGLWVHHRVEQELERAARVSAARQEAGAEGGKRSAKRRAKQKQLLEQTGKQTGKQKATQPQPQKETSSDEDVAPPPTPTPRSALEAVLSPEMADAVLKHRMAKRAKLTVGSAQALAEKLGKWPDPHEAAKEMMAAGWTGFEVEWLEARRQSRSQGPPGSGNGRPRSGMVDLIEGIINDDDGQREGEDQGDWGAVHPRRLPAPGAGGH
jgi:uncharacterized protein YdaU (DUF1376 family)